MGLEHLDDAYLSALADAEAEWLANSMAITAAVDASLRLQDRLRAANGMVVALETAGDGQTIVGVVAEVCRDAVALQSGDAVFVVPLAAVATMRGLPRSYDSAEPAPGTASLSLSSILRPMIGDQVMVSLSPRLLTGMLARVGSDHLELRDTRGGVVVSFAAIAWLRCRPGVVPGARSQGTGE